MDVRDIDNHQIVDILIVTAGGVVKTQHGHCHSAPVCLHWERQDNQLLWPAEMVKKI